jgi:hypothetical protein
MAQRNWASAGKIYSMHVKPILLDCNFIVDSTNGNGLGIRSLKGPCIKNVFMHTSATPGSNNGVLNPNPASGVIVVQLSDNYNRYFGGFSGQVTLIGSSQSTTTANTAYVITALGTATLAQWQAAGLPKGLTPTVGQAFVAIATGTIGGSATVAPSGASSGIDHIEVLGDPNQSLASNPQGSAQMLLQCYSAGTLTAPANNSTIQLSFYLGDSSILIQGE